MTSNLQPVPAHRLQEPGALAIAELPPHEREVLRQVLDRLRRSRGLVVRAADFLGSILGPAASFGLRRLSIPPALMSKAQGLAELALRRAFDLTLTGIRPGRRFPIRLSDRTGKAVAATSGAISGFAGLSGFLPDVTLTTILIMRRIAAIAAEEGEDLSTEDARAACLAVFALDAPKLGGMASETEEGDAELRYWAARFVLQGRPLVLLFSEIASGYGIRLSQKLTLQAVPLVGAAGAALINSVFLDQYQTMAHAHFTIRRLERAYGNDAVRAAWQDLSASMPRV
jgi:EcsC protein family